MNEAAMVTSVKSIEDARRVLREAAANPDEQASLRSLLKEIRTLLDSEDDEEDEALVDDAKEKEIALALRSIVLELKDIRLSQQTSALRDYLMPKGPARAELSGSSADAQDARPNNE